MAPKLKRINAEDFSDAPDWFRRFIDVINPFLGDTTSAFQAANLVKQVETFRIVTTATVSDAFSSNKVQVKCKLRTKPVSVRVGQIYPLTSTVIEDEWHAPTQLNSWTDYGTPHIGAGYMKDSQGFVHLRGLVKSGTISTAIFTLPVGYRPTAEHAFAVESNATIGTCRVQADGNVMANSGNNAWFSLSGVHFRADASTSAAQVSWQYLQNGLIRVDYINGLSPSRPYDVTLVIE